MQVPQAPPNFDSLAQQLGSFGSEVKKNKSFIYIAPADLRRRIES